MSTKNNLIIVIGGAKQCGAQIIYLFIYLLIYFLELFMLQQINLKLFSQSHFMNLVTKLSFATCLRQLKV
jgi:hypothetical protein